MKIQIEGIKGNQVVAVQEGISTSAKIVINGDEFNFTDRNGRLEVRTLEGRLFIQPEAANMVVLKKEKW